MDCSTPRPVFSATCCFLTTHLASRMSLLVIRVLPLSPSLGHLLPVESFKCQEARHLKYHWHFSPRWCGASREHQRLSVKEHGDPVTSHQISGRQAVSVVASQRAAPGLSVGTLFLASWKDHALGRNKYIPNCLWCGKVTPRSIHLPRPRVGEKEPA